MLCLYHFQVIVDTKEGATLKSEHPVTIGTTYKVGPRSQELRAEDFDRMSLCSSVVGTASTSGSSQGYPPRYSTLSLRTHGGSFETCKFRSLSIQFKYIFQPVLT